MKIIRIFLLFFLASFAAYSQQPGFDWVTALQGPADDHLLNFDVDPGGNVIIIGRFSDSISDGKNQVKSYGDRDIVVARLSPTGKPLWLKSFGGIGYDKGLNVKTDRWSNIYITGRFYEMAVFDNDTIKSHGHYDAFVAKLDSNGNILWLNSFGGRSHDEGLGIDVDISGNVYVCGFFKDTARWDNHLLSAFNYNTFEAFVLKLNTLGQYQWSRCIGGEEADHAWDIEVSNSGAVYVCGQVTQNFRTSVTSNQGSVEGQKDIFIASYSITGQFQNIISGGGVWDDIAADLCLAEGNVYVTGYYQQSLKIGSEYVVGNGFNESYVAKFDATLNPVWLKSLGGGDNDEGEGIVYDGNKSLYLCGGFKGNSTFDQQSVKSNGEYDLYLSKMDEDGNVLWVKNVGGKKNDYAFALRYANQTLYVSGYFSDTAYFSQNLLVSKGLADGFVARLDRTNAIVGQDYEESIRIYPNPASDVIHINLDQYGSRGRYVLSNLEGKRMDEGNLENPLMLIHLEDLTPGMYLLSIQTGQQNFQYKIVKQK